MSSSAKPELRVELDRIRKVFGPMVALDDVSLSIDTGEFVTLLGPSGSGKTTCLRVIAGMLAPDGGRLRIAGRDVSATPMHKRNIGMVFQNYSLFPYLSVAQNVGYALRVRGQARPELERKVQAALNMVRLQHLGHRRPVQLSGGQQQRVALARALAFDPDVLLLDEPLSALDRVLREEMQLELRRIHRETGKTMVCVTHDRSEALTMADRIVVMQGGRIVQDAAPRAIYENPGSQFVATLLGETNSLPMVLRQQEGLCEAVDQAGRVLMFDPPVSVANGPVDCLVRIENVGLSPATRTAASAWDGTIMEAVFLGDAMRFTVRLDPHTIVARVPLTQAGDLSVGMPVRVDLCTVRPMLFQSGSQTRS